MTTELAKPLSFEETVREKVRFILFDTMPEEKVDAFVQGVWNDFFEKQTQGYYNSDPKISKMQELVENEIRGKLKDMVKERVDAMFDDQQWSDTIDQNIRDTVVELAPMMFERLMAHLAQSMLNSIKNDIAQSLPSGDRY